MKTHALKRNDAIYAFALFLLSFVTIVINNSLLAENLLQVGKVLQYCILALFAFSFIQGKWKLKNIFVSLLLFLIFAYVGLAINQSMLIVNIVAIVALNNKDVKRLLPIIMWSNIISVCIVVLLCFAGILENLSFSHKGQIVYSWGFYYYTNLSFYVFCISVLALMIEKKKKRVYYKLFGLFLLNLGIYFLTTTRLTFYLFIALSIGCIIVLNIKKLKYNRYIGLLSALIYPLCAVFSLDLSINHTDAIPWRRALNVWMMNRPLMGKRAIYMYGFNLFGHEMEFDTSSVESYFYVDNGYLYTLLAYGVIVFTIVIVVYSILALFFAKTENWKGLLWVAIMALFSIVNNALLSVIFNPLLLFLPSLIKEVRYSHYDIRKVGTKRIVWQRKY